VKLLDEDGTEIGSEVALVEEPPAPPAEEKVPQITEEHIPVPTGWKVLLLMWAPPKTFDNSKLEKPDQVQFLEQHASQVGRVIDMGPMAYRDRLKYGNTPWCKIGDFVMIHRYSGRKFRIAANNYRLVDDDQIEAIIKDPCFITQLD